MAPLWFPNTYHKHTSARLSLWRNQLYELVRSRRCSMRRSPKLSDDHLINAYSPSLCPLHSDHAHDLHYLLIRNKHSLGRSGQGPQPCKVCLAFHSLRCLHLRQKRIVERRRMPNKRVLGGLFDLSAANCGFLFQIRHLESQRFV